MNEDEIKAVLTFHNYVLHFSDFKKILPHIQVNDMYLGTGNNIKIKFSINNNKSNRDILLIDIYNDVEGYGSES